MSTPSSLSPQALARMDHVLARAQQEWRAMGVSAAVVKGKERVWTGHAGWREFSDRQVATDDTQYLIGSVTKTFTAHLIMILRDAGLLTLDSTLGEFLPDAPHPQVTVRQLLSHTSGLQREAPGDMWISMVAPSGEEFRASLSDAEQILRRNEFFHYSNFAYALLGQIVEKVTGQSWYDALRERLLAPLGMDRTHPIPDDATRAIGYAIHPLTGVATVEAMTTYAALTPKGGLWSTTADMARYASFMIDPDPAILAPSTIDEMSRPVVMTDLDAWTRGFGLGYELHRTDAAILTGHGGAMPGFLTSLRVDRKHRLGVIVFTNVGRTAVGPILPNDLLDLAREDTLREVAPFEPATEHPTRYDGILGTWWSETYPLVLESRAGTLWMTVPGGPAASHTKFEELAPDVYRAVEGRERGELLRIYRDEQGAVTVATFALYALTREHLAFSELPYPLPGMHRGPSVQELGHRPEAR